jgi:ribosomal protein S12 methylthiotransferase accessory factor
MLRVERQVTLEEIEQRAWRFLGKRGYDARLRAIHGGWWGVWQCQIVTGDGNPVPGGLGAGKGQDSHARIGALCEAIEHLVTGSPTSQTILLRAQDVAARIAGDVVAPFLAEQDAELACVPYTSIIDGSGLEIPLGLSAPAYLRDQRAGDTFDYDYGPLSPYVTNSGHALGATATEALLHALNEVIERDALSLVLCKAFLGREYRPVLIDPTTLPVELAILFEHVQDVVGSPVHLLDISTDLAVPTVLAYVRPHHAHRRHGRGLGTSLQEHHAIYRALSELLQLELLDAVPSADQFHHLKQVDPALFQCAEFDLSPYLRAAECRPSRSPEVSDPIAEQLATVVSLVYSCGYTPYYRAIDTDTDGLAVVHVFVPGLERIMTLLTGHPALPGPRGLDTARQARAAT